MNLKNSENPTVHFLYKYSALQLKLLVRETLYQEAGLLSGRGNRMKKIAVVLGRGGHTAQTFALVDSLGEDFKYVYIIGLLDKLTPKKIHLKGEVFRVLTPRLLPQDSKVMSVIRTILTLFLSFVYLAILRPDVIISCGTGMTVPVFYSARTLKIPTVFIESMSRVETLSKTGRILFGRVTLFMVQWEQLAKRNPGTVYGGQLL